MFLSWATSQLRKNFRSCSSDHYRTYSIHDVIFEALNVSLPYHIKYMTIFGELCIYAMHYLYNHVYLLKHISINSINNIATLLG